MNRLTPIAILSFLRLIALLPLRLTRFLGRVLGDICWYFNLGPKRIIEENLKICFPTMEPEERQALIRRRLHHLGMLTLEMGMIWTAKPTTVLGTIRQVSGREHLEAALAQGKGVMVLAPHLGNWEVLGPYLATIAPLTIIFQPPDNPALDAIIQNARERNGANLVPTNASGVKALLKALKQGQLVGILPDQVPVQAGGVFAPFYNTPALTIKLVYTLLQRTGAQAVYGFARRIEGSGDFELVFRPAEAELYSDDEQSSLNAMNLGIENTIALAPEQYQWEYKRFKKQPDGQRRFYR